MTQTLSELKKSAALKHFVLLFIIYFVAHWFILVSSGIWFDDWAYIYHDAASTLNDFVRMSIPLAGIVNIVLWYLPYKILVFIMYYLDGLFFYKILNSLKCFSNEDCFWIAAIFLTVPINDARILYINFNFTLGLFCYLLSFYLITKWINLERKKRLILRIVSLGLLILAFNAESVMIMVVLMLLYLYYKELNSIWVKGFSREAVSANIKNFFKAVLRYIDFLLLPIFNYFIWKILFPASDASNEHGYIPWDRLPQILQNSFYYIGKTFSNLFNNLKTFVFDGEGIFISIIAVCAAIVVIAVNCKRGKNALGSKISIKKSLILFAFGLFCIYIAAFPYILKRGKPVATIYNDGRDSLLLGLGIALALYYLTGLFIRREIRCLVFVFFIAAGVLYFNNMYLMWEDSWYRQLQFQDEVKTNPEILNNDNFAVVLEGERGDNRKYTLEGNSWAATGERARTYSMRIRDVESLIDTGNEDIDGLIYMDYTGEFDAARRHTILWQKFNELFNPDEFEQWIKETKKSAYYPLSDAQSELIIEAAESGDYPPSHYLSESVFENDTEGWIAETGE